MKWFESISSDDLPKHPRRYRLPRRLMMAAAAIAWVVAAVAATIQIPKLGVGANAQASSCTAGVTQYTYDAAGRLTEVQIGCNYVVNYSYDAVGNLLSVSVTQ